MKRIPWLLQAALPVVVCSATIITFTALPASASQSSPNWLDLQQTALTVVGQYRGHGPVGMVGQPSSPSSSSMTTPSGVVSVTQEFIEASDQAGTVVVQVVLLGGQQLVVSEMNPEQGYEGATLVLQPGSSAIAGVYPLHGQASGTSDSDATVHRSIRRSRGAVQAIDATSSSSGHRVDRLVTIGGCHPAPQAPGVISSMYGYLIQGEGVIECYNSETLSLIVSIYEGSTHVGTTAGGSGSGIIYGLDAYAYCNVISGTNSFHTAQLWSVNGNLQGGATSGSSNLHCQ